MRMMLIGCAGLPLLLSLLVLHFLGGGVEMGFSEKEKTEGKSAAHRSVASETEGKKRICRQ
jgi:hypothetical protein